MSPKTATRRTNEVGPGPAGSPAPVGPADARDQAYELRKRKGVALGDALPRVTNGKAARIAGNDMPETASRLRGCIEKTIASTYDPKPPGWSSLLEYFVGKDAQGRWDGEAERFRSLEIHAELEFVRLLLPEAPLSLRP